MTDLIGKSQSYISAHLKMPGENLKAGYDLRGGNPFITISRETGAYGMTIAEMLAEYLQKHEKRQEFPWTVFDKALVNKVLEEHNLPEEFKNYLAEKPIPGIEDALEELLGVHPAKEALVRKMSQTIFRLAELGYVILVGRGANLITRKLSKGLHLRFIGSMTNRIRHMQEFLHTGEKEAHAHILKEERDRREYIRRYFRKDITDPSSYDLIINTDTMPLEEVVQMAGDLVLKGKCPCVSGPVLK